MPTEILYGYFSAKAYASCGNVTALWGREDGSTVEVTQVGSAPVPRDAGYVWDDAVCLGPVKTPLRGMGEPPAPTGWFWDRSSTPAIRGLPELKPLPAQEPVPPTRIRA